MNKPEKISREYEIPYLAGYSKNGRCIYIDKRLPKNLKLKDGRSVDIDKYLAIHEAEEKKLEDTKKYKYQYAHELATGIERKAVEADGIPWEEYQAYMLKEVEKLKHLDSVIPSDIDLKPEHDSGDTKMMNEVKKLKKVDKIPGGLADKKKPSDFDAKKLKAGIKIEMEHTNDRSIATEIAMDHLTEDSEYYKKLKEVEKYDRVETTPDGKRELDYGKEDLNKEPTLNQRWLKLKKALDSSKAIMDLSSAEGDDEDDSGEGEQDGAEQPQQQEEAQPPPDAAQQPPEAGAEAQAPAPQEDGDQAPEGGAPDQQQQDQEVIDFLREEGYEDSEIAYIIHNHSVPIPTKDDHAAQNEAAKGEARLAQMQDDHDLQQGHAKEAHQQERSQDDAEHQLTIQHKKRMGDVEYDKAKSELVDPALAGQHKKKMLDVEYEIAAKKKEQAALETDHKRRMLDLEYEKAHKEANQEDPTIAMKKEQAQFELQMKRMEKELELEFKKKELALKLKLTEEAAKQKHEHAQQQAEADAVVNAQVKEHQAKHKINEAKKPPVKEKKGE